ncbi:Vesicle transport protein SFT2B [Mortierella sp. AM989]|nr:Vesicle transport protein SFT2B [Mortierella sp. AM989]
MGILDLEIQISIFIQLKAEQIKGLLMFYNIFTNDLYSTLAIATGLLALFAVFFTLGNIVSILSTTFLIGPGKQLKTMFAPVRMVATIVFLSMIVITLIVAFTIKGASLLCLILCIIQFLALFWYSASYIPYGRAAIKKVVGSCIDV